MTTANTTLYDDIAALYKREDYGTIVNLLSLATVIEENHPHLFFFYAKAQQATKVNPYAIIETCEAAETVFPDFAVIKIIHFYALLTLDDTIATVDLGITLFQDKVTDIQFLLDLSTLLKKTDNPLADSVQYQAQFQIAQHYYGRGDYRQAEEAATSACQYQCNSHEAQLLAVKTLLAQGRLVEAQQKAEQYITHEDIRYDINRILINLYNHTNNTQALDAAVLDFVNSYPNDGYAKKLSYLHNRIQQSDSENLNHLEKTTQENELDSWWVIQRASLVHKLSSDAAFLNHSGTEEDFWTRMRTLVESGVTTHALQQAATQVDKRDDSRNFIRLCQLAFDRNETNELFKFFRSRQEILKANTELRCIYARCLANVENYNSAFSYLTNEMQCTPNDDELFGCFANLKLSFFTMIEATPTDAANLRDYSKHFQDCTIKNSKDSLSLYYLGYIRLAEKKYEEALTLLNKARSIGLVGANLPFNAYWIAYSEYKLAKHEDALSTFELWFEKRVYSSFNITEHLQLKTLISDTIKQQEEQFKKETKSLKTPFSQRVVFCLLALLINALLYNIDLSSSLMPGFALKLLAAMGAITTMLWTVNAFKYQWRRKTLLNRPQGKQSH